MTGHSLKYILATLIVTAVSLQLPAVSFRHTDSAGGYSKTSINGLYQDEFGRIWIGTKYGVKCYDGFRTTSLMLPSSNYMVMSSLVPTLCGNRDGKIYVNTDYQVLEYDFRTGRSQTVFVQESTSSPPAIAISWNRKLWIGHYNCIYSYSDGDTEPVASLPLAQAKITVLTATEGQMLIAGTQNSGIWFIKDGKSRCILDTRSTVISIFEDQSHNIWCSTLNEGVYVFTCEGKMTGHLDKELSSPFVRAVGQDIFGNIWLGTSAGLDIVGKSSGITSYGIDDGLSDTSIWMIMKDASGKMWVGSFFGGLDICDFATEYSMSYDFPSIQNGKLPQIRCIMNSGSSGILLGSEGNGMLRLDRDSRQIQAVADAPFSEYNIKSMVYDDRDGIIWICTHMGGLWSYCPSTGRYRHFTINPSEKSTRFESLTDVAIYGDTLYVGTISGVYRMDKKSGVVSPVGSINEHIFEADRLIISADRKSLWVCGNRIIRYDIATDSAEDIGKICSSVVGSEDITANSITEDHSGKMMIGTNGYGLLCYDPGSRQVSCFNKANCNLDCRNIGYIYELDEGKFLIGSENGPYFLDCPNGKSRILNDYLDVESFPMQPGDIIYDEKDGELYFAGPKGLVSLHKDALNPHGNQSDLFISGISVKDMPLKPGDGNGILSRSIQYTDKIVLPYKQNSVDIILGTSDPGSKVKNYCAFRLDKMGDSWNIQDSEEPIRLSNLRPGRYTLYIKPETLSPQDDNVRMTSLKIVIRPPFYASAAALVLYAGLIVLAAILLAKGYRKRISKRNEEISNKQKMKFIGNISHELRTPLTLIISQLEFEAENPKLSGQERAAINSIRQEAWGMKDLINDQMDALKYGKSELPVERESHELVSFVQSVCERFRAEAERKNIELTFSTDIKKLSVQFDTSLIRKALYNLLSNAFKYSVNTPARVSVRVLRPEDGMVTVSVSDNGIGIQDEMKERIFERFIQEDNAVNQDIAVTGTGIGLYLVREIMDAHHGKVTLESRFGKGSTFSILLPVEEAEEKEETEGQVMMDIEDGEAESQKIDGSILVVEDDDTLRGILLKIFESTFTMIYEASDGNEGLELATRYSPDIVISDVMMPVMAGDEMCRKIKENFETCHIPVILLTALSGVENSVSGIKCGADDYITKPFSAKLLLAKCVGIYNNRKLMQSRFYSGDSSTQLPTTNMTDRDFMNRLIALIEENVKSENITVSYLCNSLNMSHTKLFNKVKGITGQAPQEFITSIKFKAAARMLRECRQASIGEISDALGFSSINYFGKCFKERFGKTPSEYRNSEK